MNGMATFWSFHRSTIAAKCLHLLGGCQTVFSRTQDATDQAELLYRELGHLGSLLFFQQAGDSQPTAATGRPGGGGGGGNATDKDISVQVSL